MSRLIFFVLFILVLGFAVSLTSFKRLTPDNTRFDLEAQTKAHEEYLVAKYEAENPKPVKKVVEEKKEEFKVVLDTPELENGFAVYKKQCMSCHGKQGQGNKGQKAPRVASQHEWYLVKQLFDMKAGIRVNAKMNPFLRNLTEQDMKDVAAYLAKFPSWK